jgi:hypothetical protein
VAGEQAAGGPLAVLSPVARAAGAKRVRPDLGFDREVVSAVEAKDAKALEAALRAGGSPNATLPHHRTGQPDTVLCYASRAGHEDGVRLLLEYGADANKEGWNHSDPLTRGAACAAIVRLLLEDGANRTRINLVAATIHWFALPPPGASIVCD